MANSNFIVTVHVIIVPVQFCSSSSVTVIANFLGPHLSIVNLDLLCYSPSYSHLFMWLLSLAVTESSGSQHIKLPRLRCPRFLNDIRRAQGQRRRHLVEVRT